MNRAVTPWLALPLGMTGHVAGSNRNVVDWRQTFFGDRQTPGSTSPSRVFHLPAARQAYVPDQERPSGRRSQPNQASGAPVSRSLNVEHAWPVAGFTLGLYSRPAPSLPTVTVSKPSLNHQASQNGIHRGTPPTNILPISVTDPPHNTIEAGIGTHRCRQDQPAARLRTRERHHGIDPNPGARHRGL